MASNETTKKMLELYIQQAVPTMFFSGMFRSPIGNFHNSEEVELDIVRGGEEVAVAIQDLSTGPRINSADIYTSKGFKPPVYDEAGALNSHDLLKREAGVNPFEDQGFRITLMSRMFTLMMKIEAKIRRAIELQASQVLQTGTLDLKDKDGNTVYTLDFKPKATHFPTAGTAWDQVGANIIGDIRSLGKVIRADGLSRPDTIVFGEEAWETALTDDEFIKRYDIRRIDQGTISPMRLTGEGGEYRGTLEAGNYKYDIWTYDGRYTDPQTGASTPYMNPTKVIMRDSRGRLDATFGAVPNIGAVLGAQNQVNLPAMPDRFRNTEGGMDMFTNVYLSPDGKQLFGGVAARPLMQPTAIDTFGCLETGITV